MAPPTAARTGRGRTRCGSSARRVCPRERRTWPSGPPTGSRMMPGSANCWSHAYGTSRAAAAHRIRSNGAASGHPWRPLPTRYRTLAYPSGGERGLRPLQERPVILDCVYLGGKVREDGRLVPRPRADLQDPLAAREVQALGHHRHHVRLADGLALADAERPVLVGVLGKRTAGRTQPGRPRGTHPARADRGCRATPVASGPSTPVGRWRRSWLSGHDTRCVPTGRAEFGI